MHYSLCRLTSEFQCKDEPTALLRWAEKQFAKSAPTETPSQPDMSAYSAADRSSHEVKLKADPNVFTCPRQYQPNALYAILYPPTGGFGAHLVRCVVAAPVVV